MTETLISTLICFLSLFLRMQSRQLSGRLKIRLHPDVSKLKRRSYLVRADDYIGSPPVTVAGFKVILWLCLNVPEISGEINFISSTSYDCVVFPTANPTRRWVELRAIVVGRAQCGGCKFHGNKIYVLCGRCGIRRSLLEDVKFKGYDIHLFFRGSICHVKFSTFVYVSNN